MTVPDVQTMAQWAAILAAGGGLAELRNWFSSRRRARAEAQKTEAEGRQIDAQIEVTAGDGWREYAKLADADREAVRTDMRRMETEFRKEYERIDNERRECLNRLGRAELRIYALEQAPTPVAPVVRVQVGEEVIIKGAP